MRRLGAAFWIAGMGFLGAACARLLAGGGLTLPDWPALVAAAALLWAALVAGAGGWVVLLRGAVAPARLAAGFYVAQLGKYIPGGVWLGAGQVGLAVESGAGVAPAVGALTAYGVGLAAAGAAVSGVLGPLVPGLPTWLRLAAPAGVLSLALLDRRWMAALAGWVGRRVARVGQDGVVPPQRAIVATTAWAAAALLCTAASYALLLRALGASASSGSAVGAFALAWLAGYLVPGLPSGIGAREAVLVACLDPADAGVALAASLVHRLVQMAVETALVVATRRRRATSPPVGRANGGAGPPLRWAEERRPILIPIPQEASCPRD